LFENSFPRVLLVLQMLLGQSTIGM